MNKKKRRNKKLRYDRIAIVVAILLCVILSIWIVFATPKTNYSFDKKAVWFSYINMEQLKDKSQEEYTNLVETICGNVEANGLNTIILQVRPFQDAIYPSELYRVSSYISSSPTLTYDPLAIFISIAHQHNLQLEAWINPYRISHNNEQYNSFIQSDKTQAWVNQNDILQDGEVAILDPGSINARNYIVAGVKEIIDQYDVDGIHFDDYFYTTNTIGNSDETTRKENVNTLIREVYSTIKQKDASITFGISPQGNLENARSIGADIDTWLSQDGYVDYVMPQIYWSDHYGMDGSITMFSDRVQAYKNIHTNNNVKLYAGLALYLCGYEVNNDIGWSTYNNNIQSQFHTLEENQYNGYALFDYDALLNDASYQERQNMQK